MNEACVSFKSSVKQAYIHVSIHIHVFIYTCIFMSLRDPLWCWTKATSKGSSITSKLLYAKLFALTRNAADAAIADAIFKIMLFFSYYLNTLLLCEQLSKSMNKEERLSSVSVSCQGESFQQQQKKRQLRGLHGTVIPSNRITFWNLLQGHTSIKNSCGDQIRWGRSSEVDSVFFRCQITLSYSSPPHVVYMHTAARLYLD